MPKKLMAYAVSIAAILPLVVSAHQIGLSLKIAEPIGATDGSKCGRPNSVGHVGEIVLELNERHVKSWNARSGVIVAAVPVSTKVETGKLVDRCFLLGFDSRTLVRGIVLSAITERRTDLPTITLTEAGNGFVELILSSGNGTPPNLLMLEDIDGILGNQANLKRQLVRLYSRVGNVPDTGLYKSVGLEWARAVQHLMDEGQIAVGVEMAVLQRTLGIPNSIKTVDGKDRSIWYFETPMHTNPIFWAETQGTVVSAIHLGMF